MRVRVHIRGWMWGVLLGVGAGCAALAQQQGGGAPAGSVGAELRELGSRAGVVFVGRVAKIEPQGGVVEITFTVEQPVLGVAGGSYVMREWAGRWTGGQQDFQVGERAMFFLHAPGASGLSSAVDGMMGAVPVVPTGANGAALLDVRWLATRVKRAEGVASATGAIALADGVAVAKSWRTGMVAEPKGVRLPEGVVGPVEDAVSAQRLGKGGFAVPMKEAIDALR